MNVRERYKRRLIPILIFTVIVAVGAVISSGGLSFAKGRYIRTENGSHMIVMDSSPVKMTDRTNHKDSFGKISTGDEILIIHGPVAESYPGQTQVHWVLKLDGGSIENIPRDIISSLEEMGWIIIKE